MFRNRLVKFGFALLLVTGMVAGVLVQPINAARFEISPQTETFPVECTRSIEIFADATGESSSSADLFLFYDPTDIVIEDSDSEIPGKQIHTGNAYQAYVSNEVNETLGRIRMTAFSIGTTLTTRRLYARIDFTSLPGTTTTDFTIQFDGQGATLDSNIADSITNLDLLDGVTNATYTFVPGLCEEDNIRPNIQFVDPSSGARNVPLDSDVRIRLTDNLSGVDLDTLEIIINGDVYDIDSDELTVTGDALDYTIIIDPINDFFDGTASTIYVRVSDFAGNQRARTNVFNIPPAPPTDPPPPTDPGDPTPCDCGDPLSYLLESDFTIGTGSPFLDDLVGGTLNDLGVSGAGAALAGVLLASGLLSALVPLLALINAPGLLINILSYFLGKRHDRPWGVVLDASTGKTIPFATCRLYLAETTNLLTQTVSDTEGRYGFVISPGSYRLELTHSDYAKFAENFTISETDEVYIKDVKLIPKTMEAQISQSSLGQAWESIKDVAKRLWRAAKPIIYVVGFTLSLVSVTLSPSFLNWVIFALYVLSLVLVVVSIINKRPKFAAVIDSTTNLRIPYAVVKFYDASNWKLVDTQVTNGNGQFDFYGESGEYGILVAVRGYKFPSDKQVGMEVVENKYSGMLKATLKKGRNALRLYVDPDAAALGGASLEPALRAQPNSDGQGPDDGASGDGPAGIPMIGAQTAGNLPTPFS